MDNLRGVYLPPLRDASLGLRPSRSSQLARLVHILADDAGRLGVDEALKNLDAELKNQPPLVDIQSAISGRHSEMLGSQWAQALEVGLSASNFQRFSSRLALTVDSFEIEQNGLGFNNLIFMAVVLSELAKNPEAAYRGLIIEEPEAHLHPQLQAVLLRYLQGIKTSKKGNQKASENATVLTTIAVDKSATKDLAATEDRPVQVFVTSHSPNFASIAKLSSLVCLVEADKGVGCFLPRSVNFDKGKLSKLERYLDVTRAELFFARRIIFVEGAAEMMVRALLALLKNPPPHLNAGIMDTGRHPEFRELRRTLWAFTRNSDIGLPAATLKAASEWHTKLVPRVTDLLKRIEEKFKYSTLANLGLRLKKTSLPDDPMVKSQPTSSPIDSALRVETVHGVKGESLDAVLYLADKDHVKAMVDGTGKELGRIGYVALTRARNLFWLGLLDKDAMAHRKALLQSSFIERDYTKFL